MILVKVESNRECRHQRDVAHCLSADSLSEKHLTKQKQTTCRIHFNFCIRSRRCCQRFLIPLFCRWQCCCCCVVPPGSPKTGLCGCTMGGWTIISTPCHVVYSYSTKSHWEARSIKLEMARNRMPKKVKQNIIGSFLLRWRWSCCVYALASETETRPDCLPVSSQQ